MKEISLRHCWLVKYLILFISFHLSTIRHFLMSFIFPLKGKKTNTPDGTSVLGYSYLKIIIGKRLGV